MTRLHLKYVHQFRDRHDHLRHYFRRRGSKTMPLPGLPGSEEFMEAYQAALANETKLDVGASRTLPGTINALAVSYYRSSEWNGLTHKTQTTRRPIIEWFRLTHGNKRVAMLRKDHIIRMMGEIAKPSAKRHWLKAIRGLMQAAVPTMRKDDPTEGIVPARMPKTKGHHTWTDGEIEQYRAYWRLGMQQRLVMEFALEALSRRCEVVRLGPQHVKDGRIKIERAKGSRDVDIQLTPELQAACDAMPKEHLTFVVNAYGKPRSIEGLGRVFAEWATEAGLPSRCRMHGLKKGGMRRLAESGTTTHELAAISGHVTLAMVQLYTADADRRKLADSGMAKRIGNVDAGNPERPPMATPLKELG